MSGDPRQNRGCAPGPRFRGPSDRNFEGFPRRRRHPGRLFLRFAFTFGFLAVLVLGGMWTFARLLTQMAGGDGPTSVLVWMAGLGMALSIPVLAITVATRAFRGFAEPLSDLMAAADSVAEGDLSVRVAERGGGDFRRLIHSFNRMTEELDVADERRRNLTADVAHELRTPLHIIQGNLEGVIDGVYEPTTEHMEATLGETRALARLVDDLQTLSLAEAGQLPMIWETVDLGELLADIRTSFSGQAEAAGIGLGIKDAAASALTITGDYDRLNQVLTNLVANALRHTPAGGSIILRAAPIPDGAQITITDSGSGIPDEQIPFLFDRFWRGDPSRTRTQATGNSGLGLAITKQLIQMHGGRIDVESEVGRGTTFTLALPKTPPVRG